ncbi:reverse transcriptase domain-containing protein [Tanacetum coccineum]
MFTRLGNRDMNVFTRLGERKKDIHSPLGPEGASHRRHASDRRSASTGRSGENPNHMREEARNLIRSYVTCSSESQREIKREWDATDRANRRQSTDEEDLSQPWLCEETDPFTTWIRNFEVPKRTRMPTNVKTYDGTGDPEDHLKIFQTAAKIERWAVPIWCHMFNSTLIGTARFWFDKLPSESIDSYEILQKAFIGNFSQQKKYIKDPVKIHHIKQREGELTEAFVERFKAKSMHVNGGLKWMRISRFMHGITNPDLIKRLNDNILKCVYEMMSATKAFLIREVVVANQSRKKAPSAWKHHEASHKPNFDKRPDFKNRHKLKKRRDSQNKNKLCEFHGDKGHSTDECIHLRKQIEEAVKSCQLSHLIKELKQGGNKGEHAKTAKKEEASNKEKATAIFMVQSWKRVTRQRITQSFSASQEISFPPLASSDGQENLIVIEAEVDGHLIHRMYVDGGSASKVLYEHCFNRLRPEIKNQMTQAITPFLGFNDEISWPLGQISMMVSLGDGEHSTNALMNFMVARSPSPYNGIIRRPGLRKIQAIPSTTHRMLKFPIERGIVTLCSNIIPAECRMVVEAPNESLSNKPTVAKGIKVAIHPEYPKQTVMIGGSLSEKGKMELYDLLRSNLDIFSWKPADTTRVPRSIAEHCLNIREWYPPIRQKRRWQAPDRNKAIQEEVTKLVDAQIMREVHYHNWLSNPLMKGIEFTYAIRFEFDASNNEAKYEALVAGLRIAEQMGVQNLEAKVDSRLVANQINGSYIAKEQSMTSGQVERANRSLGEGIKARLGEENKNWVEEVPHVLWLYHTTIKTRNGHTSFSLTYDTEAVIPVEIAMPSLSEKKPRFKKQKAKQKWNDTTTPRSAAQSLNPETLSSATMKLAMQKNGKLGPKWEGPYKVVEALGKGAYKLRNGNGDIHPQTWNVKDLKKCYL